MSKEDLPICSFIPFCAPLSVHHISVGCTAVEASRLKYFKEIYDIPFVYRFLFILSKSPSFRSGTTVAFLHELHLTLRSNYSSTVCFSMCLGVDPVVGYPTQFCRISVSIVSTCTITQKNYIFLLFLSFKWSSNFFHSWRFYS